jgi:Membrane proteins related to metalloendopeptidases
MDLDATMGRLRRVTLSIVAIAAVFVGSTMSSPVLASPADTPVQACAHPEVPVWFHKSLATAIHVSHNLPPAWAGSPYLAKIICWQGSGFSAKFLEHSHSYHQWHGIFAMTMEEMRTVAGPWMSNNPLEFKLSAPCFLAGWDRCVHTTANTRTVQQEIAGLRWIWLTYGTPKAAWAYIVRTARFNSLPRKGTDDIARHRPLGICPIAGRVSYRDDFGERRTVGGYHPHWGNDIIAGFGRKIRAPFAGLAVAHSDNWFAGNYVTVVGANGFVRNGHLSRFGTLGYVNAGTVIGYVGETGDAAAPHDHFEWHPWVVPTPRHRAPSGFHRVMDAIDPFPFLNAVCGVHKMASTQVLEGV